MKEIRLFIENTSAPYVNKIIFLYVDIFLVQLALCFINITEDINTIMLLTFYPSFLLLFLIHRSRYKTFMSEGGLTRVRLLPIRKSTFLYSELLFQFMTYLGLPCISTLLLIGMETYKGLQTVLLYAGLLIIFLFIKLIMAQTMPDLQVIEDWYAAAAMLLLIPVHAIQLKSCFMWKRRKMK